MHTAHFLQRIRADRVLLPFYHLQSTAEDLEEATFVFVLKSWSKCVGQKKSKENKKRQKNLKGWFSSWKGGDIDDLLASTWLLARSMLSAAALAANS